MKKIIFMFTLALMMQTKAFPNFEMSLTVPLGMSFIFPNVEGTKLKQYFSPYPIDYDSMRKQALGVNAGVLMQMGTRFDLKKK